MTIRIEITGESIPEVADKLLALASTMRAIPAEAATVGKPQANKAKPASEAPKQPVVELKFTGEDANEPDAGNAAAPAEEPAPSKTADTSTDAPAPSASDEAPLDFDKEVAPVVLKAVQVKGKPWVQEILGQFGVERASHVPAEQLRELLNVLLEGIG